MISLKIIISTNTFLPPPPHRQSIIQQLLVQVNSLRRDFDSVFFAWQIYIQGQTPFIFLLFSHNTELFQHPAREGIEVGISQGRNLLFDGS